jgi:hypothetical protein
MARPQNTNELRRIQFRTVALMNTLKLRTGIQNPYQFGDWINKKTELLDWADSKYSKKWYPYFEGKIKQEPLRVLQLLNHLFPDASAIYYEGPERLWSALWDPPKELWSICGFLVGDYPAQSSEELTTLTGSKVTFCESAYNFECSLILNQIHGQEPNLRDFVDSIALYRLHHAVSQLHKTDEVGPYRCVQMCLKSNNISRALANLEILDFISNELINLEISRLNNEESYRTAVAVDDVVAYAHNPFEFCSVAQRIKALRID